MSSSFMMLKKDTETALPVFHPFSVTHHLFLIRVNVSGAVSPVSMGKMHHRQVNNASQTAHQGQLRVSNQPNIVTFRREVVKNSRVPRETSGSNGEPSCCEICVQIFLLLPINGSRNERLK